MRAYQARPDREWTRATAPQKPRAAAWAGVLAAPLLAWGCEATGGDDHAAPRDVEAALDVAQDVDTADVDAAVGQVADAAPGDAAEVDVALVDGADAKNCPPGTQIKGCPCVKPPWHEDYGCCLAIGAGLSCEGPKGAELWYEIGDCCTEEEPHCGSTKPSSGFAPLCLSKPLP